MSADPKSLPVLITMLLLLTSLLLLQLVGVESREACIHNPAEFTGQLELLLLDPSTELQPICSGKRLGTRTQVLADDGSDPDTLRLI